MNAPVYYMLHALPVVVVVGVILFLLGGWIGSRLWKGGAEQADQFQAEINELERKAAKLRDPKEEAQPAS